MANSQTEHSKKLRAKTATAFNKAKLQSSEYKQMRIQGKATQIDLINTAIEQAGGSKVSALEQICREWIDMQKNSI